MPQSRMVSATRVMRARTPVSRSGVPTWPWRYLLATMLVAVMDQSAGTSTSFCSKMILPFQSWMTASRSSHVISSKGETVGLVKWRSKVRPGAVCLRAGAAAGAEVEAAAAAAVVTVDSAMVVLLEAGIAGQEIGNRKQGNRGTGASGAGKRGR